MSDYDPNRMDPKRPAVNEAGYAADRGFNWSWIIGGIAAIVVLLVALSYMGGSDDRTAETDRTPATTTGQAPRPAPAPKAMPAPAPSATPTAPTVPNATPAERPAPPPATNQ